MATDEVDLSDRTSTQPEGRHRQTLVRFVSTHDEIERAYHKPDPDRKTFRQKCSSTVNCSKLKCIRYMTSLLPIVSIVRNYQFKQCILGDILSGISAGCLHFPQGLAFGILASLTPAYGLYTSFFPVLLYVLFGTSAYVSFGTNAIIAMFTAEMVDMAALSYHPTGNSSEINGTISDDGLLEFKAATAASATLLVGILLLLMGLLRLGFITTYLSTSFIGGFTTSAAFHIATSQVNKAFGFLIPTYTGIGKIVKMYIAIFTDIAQTNVASIIIALISMIILILVKDCVNDRFKDRLKMPVPIDLILVVMATIISHFANFHGHFGVKVVGKIPSGIPAPQVPNFTATGSLFVTIIIVAILVFFLTIAMAKLCAKKHGIEVDDNQELVAYGVCNLGSAFFHCFPCCTAPPRSMILSDMGAKTTLNGISSALFVLIIILAVGQLLTSLPVPVLAAMIMVAVKGILMQVTGLPQMWRINKYDCVTWVVTCATGILLDLPYGLVIGIVCSIFTVVVQSQLSNSYVLGKTGKEDRFLDLNGRACVDEMIGVKIFRMESSLYFATTDLFRKRLYKTTVDPRVVVQDINKASLRQLESLNVNVKEEFAEDDPFKLPVLANHETRINHVIIDCQPINYLDMNGVAVLSQIFAEFRRAGICVYLARCSSYMHKVLDTAAFYDKVSRDCVFADIDDALSASGIPPSSRGVMQNECD